MSSGYEEESPEIKTLKDKLVDIWWFRVEQFLTPDNVVDYHLKLDTTNRMKPEDIPAFSDYVLEEYKGRIKTYGPAWEQYKNDAKGTDEFKWATFPAYEILDVKLNELLNKDYFDKSSNQMTKRKYNDYCDKIKTYFLTLISEITGNNHTLMPEPMPQPIPQPIPQPMPQPIPQPMPQPMPQPIPVSKSKFGMSFLGSKTTPPTKKRWGIFGGKSRGKKRQLTRKTKRRRR